MADALAGLTWPEIEQRAPGAVLAVPIGSTEQHGPHLPLSTDTDIAVALCQALAAGRDDVLVAPAVNYGSSGEHAGFAGTLSIGQAALELLLVELGRSASETFEHLVFVSGHGGNAITVTRAANRLREESRDVLVFAPRWDGDLHAGRVETSLALAMDAAQVRLDRAVAGDLRPLPEIWEQLRRDGVRAVNPNGVLGDPTGATADEGRAILDQLGEQLLEAVDTWRAVTVG